MRRIVLSILCIVLALTVSAKRSVKSVPLTEEERQRFLYYFYEALHQHQQEHYGNAYMLMQFCNQINPNDAIVHQYIGDIIYANHRLEEALSYYERSYALDKQNTPVLYRLEQVYIDLKQFDHAIDTRHEIDRRNGYNTYSATRRFQIYALANDSKNALRTVEDYLRYDPYNADFLIYRVQLYEMSRVSFKKLQAAYESALEVIPSEPTLLNNYAYALATHKGDLKRAEQMSGMAIRQDPNNPTFLDTYAWILYLKGEKTLAQFYIKKALYYIGNQAIPNEIQDHYKLICAP